MISSKSTRAAEVRSTLHRSSAPWRPFTKKRAACAGFKLVLSSPARWPASITVANGKPPVPVVNQIRTYWWCSPPRIWRKEYARLVRRRGRSEHLSPKTNASVSRVIIHVRQQDVTEVSLAEHNNVVKAFPADRTDQPFSISILPKGRAATSGGLECRSTEPGGQRSRHRLDLDP